MTVANASDAFLPSSVKIVHKTRRDKAHLPEERERIESAGGDIQLPQIVFGETTLRLPCQGHLAMHFLRTLVLSRIQLSMYSKFKHYRRGLQSKTIILR